MRSYATQRVFPTPDTVATIEGLTGTLVADGRGAPFFANVVEEGRDARLKHVWVGCHRTSSEATGSSGGCSGRSSVTCRLRLRVLVDVDPLEESFLVEQFPILRRSNIECEFVASIRIVRTESQTPIRARLSDTVPVVVLVAVDDVLELAEVTLLLTGFRRIRLELKKTKSKRQCKQRWRSEIRRRSATGDKKSSSAMR